MIIIHVMGGFGNQLYQYAMYEKLKLLGKEVKLDLSAYRNENVDDVEWRELELEWLDSLSYEVCTPQERIEMLDSSLKLQERIRRKLLGKRSKLVEETRDYMPEVLQMDDVFLYGFWNCEKYYENMDSLLQNKIRFRTHKDENGKKNQEIAEKMEKENSVSIHIRRSDYLTVADGKRYMGICTQQYYEAAKAYIEERVENPVYYIFSDDIPYVKKYYTAENMHVIDWNKGERSMYDMELMSHCKHNICANSTFSFWGAKLNRNPEKIRIRPLRHDNYEVMEKKEIENMHDYWNTWILIDSAGNVQ